MLAAGLTIAGCSGDAGGSHHLSEREWQQIISIPAEQTRASSRMVQHDAESRRQWLSLQRDLAQQQSELSNQRDQLEQDRRIWSSRQRGDPIIAATISVAGLLVACSLPLIVVTLLLWPGKSESSCSSSEAAFELLLNDYLLAGNPDRRHLLSREGGSDEDGSDNNEKRLPDNR